MGLRFNPFTGNLDFDTKPDSPSGDSTRVQKDYLAGEPLSALRMVKFDDPTTVSLADKNLLSDAVTIGMGINSATIGNAVTVVTFGQIDDASFMFSANACLFLDDNGQITDTPPTSGHNVPIGVGLGAGSIFIDIDGLTVL